MIDRDGNDLMAKATNVSLLYLIVVTWLFGGGFSWGPYLVGGGGILCLVFALRAARLEGQQRWWSWRLLPWVLWLFRGLGFFSNNVLCRNYVGLDFTKHQDSSEDESSILP